MKRRPEPFVPPGEEDGYRGPAVATVGGRAFPVEVHLAHHFEPLDGRTHWYGRIQDNADLTALKRAGATEVTLSIDDLAADARLAEFDAWGNLALRAVGAPPYRN